jgi:hypothetical protein
MVFQPVFLRSQDPSALFLNRYLTAYLPILHSTQRLILPPTPNTRGVFVSWLRSAYEASFVRQLFSAYLALSD